MGALRHKLSVNSPCTICTGTILYMNNATCVYMPTMKNKLLTRTAVKKLLTDEFIFSSSSWKWAKDDNIGAGIFNTIKQLFRQEGGIYWRVFYCAKKYSLRCVLIFAFKPLHNLYLGIWNQLENCLVTYLCSEELLCNPIKPEADRRRTSCRVHHCWHVQTPCLRPSMRSLEQPYCTLTFIKQK